MKVLKKPGIQDEKAYQKELILSQKERYLANDVMHKASNDYGYKAKLQNIEVALGNIRGWVLDVGSNTCGEAEYLSTKGYLMIATDINESALSISRERVAKHSRRSPHYLTGDAHNIPIADESVSFAILYETLHHMDDPHKVMNEVSRVLIPGGRAFLFEPYAYNPYRRLSELRDRFKGTIEQSFSLRELKGLITDSGLTLITVEHQILPPSQWKLEFISRYRRYLRNLYFSVSRLIPRLFGNIMVLAEKASNDAFQR